MFAVSYKEHFELSRSFPYICKFVRVSLYRKEHDVTLKEKSSNGIWFRCFYVINKSCFVTKQADAKREYYVVVNSTKIISESFSKLSMLLFCAINFIDGHLRAALYALNKTKLADRLQLDATY